MSEKRICRFELRPPRRNGETIFLDLGLENGQDPTVEVSITFGQSQYPLKPNISDIRHILRVLAKELDNDGKLQVLDPDTKKGMKIDGKAIMEILKGNIIELSSQLSQR